jgi:Flp pilus assembly protein TadB
MVTALTPLAIILGGALAAAFIFASVWKNFVGHISGFGSFYERELDLADMQIKPHELGFVVVTIAALAWIGMIVLLRPGVFVGIGCVPIVLGITAYGVRFYLRMRITKNIKLFREQFESVLRSLASGVRVGLGLRQALLLVAEQSRNPAKK